MNIKYNKKMKGSSPCKNFEPTYKLEICKTVEGGMVTTSETSQETGISYNTLYGWMKRYRDNREKTFMGSGYILPENEEMARLCHEN